MPPVQLSRVHRGDPPGPRTLSPLGHSRDIQQDAITFAQNMWDHYGDVVRIRFLSTPGTIVYHPDAVEQVLQKKHQDYDKQTIIFQAVKSLLGEGLFTNDGPSWLHNRRLIQPKFHRKNLQDFGAIMTRCTLEVLDHWQVVNTEKEIFDIPEEMAHLTLRIMAQALLSTESDEESALIRATFAAVWPPFARFVAVPFPPLSVPTPRNLRIRRAARDLDHVLYTTIAKRRHASSKKMDLLQLLLDVRDEQDEAMSDRQIRDELVNMFIAGHETTAHTLVWFWYALSQHPEVETKLLTELDEVIGGDIPTVDHLSQLVYLQQVVNETLRLYPPSFAIVRHAIREDEIGGFRIPANSILFTTPYFTQRHPAFWPNPLTFDPQRFTPEQVSGRHRFAFFPFGAGPRICIGNSFALMELHLVVATVLQRYRLRLIPNHRVEPWAALTMRPRYGLPMTVHPR